MNFLFEKNQCNFISCTDVNPSGIRRFTVSPLISTLQRFKITKKRFNNFNIGSLNFDNIVNRKKYEKFIIPSGVTHSPVDWCGQRNLNKIFDPYLKDRDPVFAFLAPKYIKSIQNRKAFILLDQSHEGYHTDWLFDWFHVCCEKYNIPPSQVIYVTGNLSVEHQYNEYIKNKNIKDKIFVVPHIQFENFIYEKSNGIIDQIPTVDQHLKYKKENLNSIKLFNAFQKRTRPHRIWLYKELYINNLISDGIISMNFFDLRNSFYEGKLLDQELYQTLIKDLPIFPEKDLSENQKKEFVGDSADTFAEKLNYQSSLDSWISVVSEASFAESTCFISEKTFKPIATRHPFILYGNKNSLKYLRDLGYKTFTGFIDESYDNLDTWERLDAVVKLLKDFKSTNNMLDWFDSQREILDYNFENLKNNSITKLPTAVLKISEYIENV
jgi:hypothetical protein